MSSFSLVLQITALQPSGLYPGGSHPKKHWEFKISLTKCSHFLSSCKMNIIWKKTGQDKVGNQTIS